MYIYILDFILICAMGFWCVYYKKHYKLFIFLSFLIMALTVGFRGAFVGEDTNMYLNVAIASQHMSFGEIISEFPKSTWGVDIHGYPKKIETAYLLYNKIIMTLTGHEQLVLIITALITCWGFGKFIYDNSRDVFLATYVFLCEVFFMSSFNLMRQILAISIGVNSYTYFKKGNYKKGLALIFIASMFHQSAFIYLTIPILLKIKNKQKSVKYIFISSIILVQITPLLYIIVNKFSPYYASYLKVSYWEPDINGIIILWIIEFLMITFMYFKKIKDVDDYIMVVYTILYLAVEIIGIKYTAIARVALYFRVFTLLLFARFKEKIKKEQQIFYILVIYILLGILYFKTAGTDVRLYRSFFIN